jgi:UDP-glucose 4-epimerase
MLGAMMMLPQQPPTTHDPLHLVAVVALVYLTAGQVPELRLLDSSKCLAVNLGTSAGSSVFDAICVFETVGGKRVPYDVSAR